MRVYAMRSLAVLVLALVAISTVSASECDRPTCPPGPIFIHFEHENCTGESVFDTWGGPFDVCQIGSDGSTITYNRGTYIEEARYFGVSDCGGGSADAIISRGILAYFGTCQINTGLRKVSGATTYNGSILLDNVNATYTSPQTFVVDPTIPVTTGSLVTESCTSEQDCQAKGGIYYQSYTNDTCSETTNYEARTEMIPYKCYREGSSYVMLGCHGPHTISKTYFIDSACTTTRYSAIVGEKCGLAFSTTTYQCTATRPVAPAPTSSASIFQPIAIVHVAAILLAVFF